MRIFHTLNEDVDYETLYIGSTSNKSHLHMQGVLYAKVFLQQIEQVFHVKKNFNGVVCKMVASIFGV